MIKYMRDHSNGTNIAITHMEASYSNACDIVLIVSELCVIICQYGFDNS